jgi:hypothetical protein
LSHIKSQNTSVISSLEEQPADDDQTLRAAMYGVLFQSYADQVSC